MYKIKCRRTIGGSIEKHTLSLFEKRMKIKLKLSDVKQNSSCDFGTSFRRTLIFGIIENAHSKRKMSNYKMTNDRKLSRRAKRVSSGLPVTIFFKR